MANIETIITENIDVWTSALRRRATQGRGSNSRIELYGVRKLRELILDLAVRGLLVPQDPSEEPASTLLESIELEKKQLIKEGEIRKQKKLPKVEKGELGITLPFGWESIRVGDIGRIFNGNSINAKVKEDKYTGIQGLPYIATKDVGYGFESFDYENGIAIPLGEASFRVAPKGSVLICAEGGSAGKKCGIANQDICFGNKLYANHLFANVESKYILAVYLSPTFYEFFAESMAGIIGGISRAKFILLPLALPPLEEQKRIVKKVDELMALCDQLEEQQENSITAHQQLVEVLLTALIQAADQEGFDQAWSRIAANFEILFTTESSVEQLKQMILQLAVMGKLVKQNPEDEPAKLLLEKLREKYSRKEKNLESHEGVASYPFQVPKGWAWARFPELGEWGRGRSRHRPRNAPVLFKDGIWPLIQTGDVANSGGLITSYHKAYSNFGLAQSKLWPKGTLCITIAANIADSAFLGIDACFPDSVVGLVPDDVFDGGKYFEYFIRTAKQNLTDYAPSTAQKNINLGILEQVNVPMPPVEEQKRIVKKVEDLFAICDQFKTQLRTAQETKLKLADAITSQAVQ